MKKLPLYLALLLLAACSSNEQRETKNDSTANPQQTDTLLGRTDDHQDLDTTDVDFFEQAAYGSMIEVESSKKILTVTEDEGIKAFANMMVTDHGNANGELKRLAQSKGYVLPTSLPNSKMELINKMDTYQDEGRNEYYLQLMLNEHNKAIDLFSLASRSTDQDIKTFASNLLPTLKHHYKEVAKLDSLFKQPRANQGDDPLKISDRKKH